MLSLNPGSGKSESCKKYIKNNNLNGLFVINNNNLGIEISKDGFTYITPHLLLGLQIEGQETENKYTKNINLEEYDVIVFEEIFFNDLNILLKLYELMENNKDKIFLANGDSEQLECKEDVIDSDKKSEFVNIMFPNYIELEIIKRCGCLSKQDCIDKKCNSSIMYLINDYIKQNKNSNITDKEQIDYIMKTFIKKENIINKLMMTGISYTNETKSIYNNIIQKMKYGTTDFVIDQIVIAKEHYRHENGLKLFRNYEYKITNINKFKDYTFVDTMTGNEFKLNEQLFNKYLDKNYVKTVHASQGCTIRKKYIIYDWKYNYVSIKWFKVALSRTNDIDNVYFYDGEENSKPLKYSVNIEGYKQQDKNKNRIFNEKEFIDNKWVSEQLLKQKSLCHKCGDVINKITCDRLDNNLAHIKSNTILSCMMCNVSTK